MRSDCEWLFFLRTEKRLIVYYRPPFAVQITRPATAVNKLGKGPFLRGRGERPMCLAAVRRRE
jgi:hypothetical protein